VVSEKRTCSPSGRTFIRAECVANRKLFFSFTTEGDPIVLVMLFAKNKLKVPVTLLQ